MLRLLGLVLVVAILVPLAVAAGKDACIVAIDIGHSEKSPGAVSARGVDEYIFNQKFAQSLLEQLHKNGLPGAVLIENQGLSLQQRTEAALRLHATLLISIHHDSVQPLYLSTWNFEGKERRYCDRFSGYSLFYSTKNEQGAESLNLAQNIGGELVKAGFHPTLHHAEMIAGESRDLVDQERGIYIFDDLIVLKTAAMPAALLECGLIVNRKEEEQLSSTGYRNKMVKAVAKGIEKACPAKAGEQVREIK